DDVDAIEDAGDAAARQLLGDDDERLGAGGLVAVLGGDDDDGRPTRCTRRGDGGAGDGAGRRRTREGERVDRRAELRDAERNDADFAAVLADRGAARQAAK